MPLRPWCDVADEVGAKLGIDLPGGCVQNMVKRARRMWRGAQALRMRSDGSVETVQEVWSNVSTPAPTPGILNRL